MKNIIFEDYEKVEILGRLRVCVELAKKQNLRNKVVLDAGCANGVMAHILLSEKPKKYIGADPNKDAINLARKKIKGAEFHVAPADNIPVKDNIADVALFLDVIEHVPVNGELAALKEIHRILKKDGKLVLSTPNNNIFTILLDPAWFIEGHRHYGKEQIKDLLQKAGFKNIKIEVRGGILFSIYLDLLYVSKWIFRRVEFKNKLIQGIDDRQFSKPGIHTLFATAQKK